MEDADQKRIFANNLSHLIEKSGKTQSEVADALHENRTTVNNWCRGVALPRINKIQALAEYFHVPKSLLIDEMNPSERIGRIAAEAIKEGKLQEAIYKYSGLSEEDKRMVINLINHLYRNAHPDH